MGKRKHLDAIERILSISPVVGFRSIDRMVKSSKKRICTKGGYTKLLVSNLLRQKKIIRLAKGCYTKHKDASLTVFCYKPAYLGLQSALSKHNLWEQETIPIIITCKKARTGMRRVMGGNVQIFRTETGNLFGYELLQDGDFYLPYSDIEKTLIDMVVFNQHIPDGVLTRMGKMVNAKKISEYLKKIPPHSRKKMRDFIASRKGKGAAWMQGF